MKIIIIGCGKVGLTLAELLSAEKHDVVLIDESSQKLSSIPEELELCAFWETVPASISSRRQALKKPIC